MTIPARTTHQTYARWTQAGVQHAVGTDDAVRGGVAHIAALADDAGLADSWVDDVARGASVQLRVVDRPDLCQPILTSGGVALLTEDGDVLLTEFAPYASLTTLPVDGLQVTVETVTTVDYTSGPPAEFVRVRTLTCTARERVAGAVVLTLTDVEDARLNVPWPPRVYTTADFPALLDSDAGRPVPRPMGTALKIPAVPVDGAATSFVLMDMDGALGASVLTVYRNGRVVGPAEYTAVTAAAPWPLLRLDFTREQRDFSGALYQITADVLVDALDVTAAAVIAPLAAHAGITLDAPSLAALPTTTRLSCDFGRTGQRLVRAIIEDVLWAIGATLYRTDTGSYAFAHDGLGTPVAAYNEDAGDDIEVLSVSDSARPSSVSIRYRPSPRDGDALQFVATRAVEGGTQGAERPRDLRYLRRHEFADRAACYRAVRAQLCDTLRARIYRRSHVLGDVLTITSRALGVYGTQWRVRSVRSIVGGVEIEATPYSDALGTYVPGTLPADAASNYEPDYSNTPPAAPSGLRITATAAARQADGTLVGSVTADVLPPAANWAQLWFAAVHNVTGELTMGQGAAVGGGRYGITLTGLRPGEVYQLKAYAINAFGLQGVTLGTFDATAIGGGATATTFTCAGWATLPPNVTSCSAAQGMGRIVHVSWPAAASANLREYVLERRIFAGTWDELWRGRATGYTDRAVAYATSYTYRVRAVDSWGNASPAWATSAAISLTTGTVYGGSSGNDIGGNTVATTNRTNVSTVSAVMVLVGLNTTTLSIPHGLGRTPIAVIAGGPPQALLTIRSSNDTNVNVFGAYFDGSTNIDINPYTSPPTTGNNSAAGDPHAHVMTEHQHQLRVGQIVGGSGTVSLMVW